LALAASALAQRFLPADLDPLPRGMLLQQALRATLDHLRPAGPISTIDRGWWPYLICTGEYETGQSRTEIQEDLALSASTYSRAKRQGLDRITAVLPRMIERMIECGGDVNVTDDRGESVYQHAVRFGHPELAILLERHGANETAARTSPHEIGVDDFETDDAGLVLHEDERLARTHQTRTALTVARPAVAARVVTAVGRDDGVVAGGCVAFGRARRLARLVVRRACRRDTETDPDRCDDESSHQNEICFAVFRKSTVVSASKRNARRKSSTP